MSCGGTRVYFTPIIFHFGVVLVVSAIAVVPELPAPAVSLVVALCAINGCAYSAATMGQNVATRIRRPAPLVR